jgi:RimJ/RimL family protein N-acetyltransferase
MAYGFEALGLPEIIAFTARTNLASQAVMRRIGMAHDPARDFDHPGLAEDHPLRPHVVFVARA